MQIEYGIACCLPHGRHGKGLISRRVKRENDTVNTTVIREKTWPEKEKTLPVIHFGEIIDRPAVRVAVQKAVAKLTPAYECLFGKFIEH